jgi:hypothetical protein
LKIIELHQAQHRDIISTIKFFEIFIGIVAEKPGDVKDLKSSSANLSECSEKLGFGASGANISNILKNSATLSTENSSNTNASADMPASDANA